jgi:hypothetical protein
MMTKIFWIFKALKVAAAIGAWANKALADGKVNIQEISDLAEAVCNALGVPIEFDLPEEQK